MNKNFIYLTALTLLFLGFACVKHGGTAQKLDPLVSHIDSTIKPGDDFFLYSNGKWFKQNPIPASEQSNGFWQLIQDTIDSQICNICKSSAALTSATRGSNKQKIGDFYFSGMDSVSLNKNGLGGLKEALSNIDGLKDKKDLAAVTAYISSISGSPLFTFGVGQDDRNSSKYAVGIWQGGLSLPDRDFYFDMDARAIDIRKKFLQHLTNAFELLGYDAVHAKSAATQLMNLETILAKSSRKREDLRDPLKNYNKMTFFQLQQLTPDFDWVAFMNKIGLPKLDTVIVGQPQYLKDLNNFIVTIPIDAWKDYLRYQLLHNLSFSMDDKTYMEFFGFYKTTLRGVKEPQPRWKRVVGSTDAMLGELIGQVYVEEYLPKGTKEKLLEIGNAIKTVYADHIKKLDWMSPITKEKALEKLKSITMKVGYPDKWKDMRNLTIDRISFVHNIMKIHAWETNYSISKYGKPVDRSEWGMEPQTYNAYYNPSNNEIVVPGCNIIIPGYERKMADDALLYSVIGGSTFGHEITHGFDDQGCKYDGLGNLNNWWTASDSTRFYKKTKMIVKQFNNYVAVDSLHINGELTQGENIADLGGIMMGYEAFKKTRQYINNEFIGGLNPDKRFFIGYAFAWMINERPEATANQVRSNEHSPAKFRVIGPLTDMESFYAAFDIQKGDKMWREDSVRVHIW